MKWNNEDMEMYVKAREYVDTIVLPLYPISLDDKIQQTAGMSDFISLLSVQLERHFKGRLILMPGYIYLKTTSEEELTQDILKWEEEFLHKGFKYVYYLTSDSDWKRLETSLKGSLIWLPTIPFQKMDDKSRNTILEDQVKQLVEIFIQKWHYENE
jgi:hypothetical protein